MGRGRMPWKDSNEGLGHMSTLTHALYGKSTVFPPKSLVRLAEVLWRPTFGAGVE